MRIPATAALLLLGLASPLAAQVVHGRVVDVATGAPVRTARVRLLEARGAVADSALTDTAGVFTLRGKDGGRFRLAAARVGYAASVSSELEIGARDSMEVLFRVAADTVLLEPLEVVGLATFRSPRVEAFYQRAERKAFGYFLTREQIERRSPWQTSDLLRMTPGLRLVLMRRGGYAVRGRGGCVPAVYLDGFRLPDAADQVDQWVNWRDLEGVEVYAGIGQVPPEVGTVDNGCGALLFWTRDGSTDGTVTPRETDRDRRGRPPPRDSARGTRREPRGGRR